MYRRTQYMHDPLTIIAWEFLISSQVSLSLIETMTPHHGGRALCVGGVEPLWTIELDERVGSSNLKLKFTANLFWFNVWKRFNV